MANTNLLNICSHCHCEHDKINVYIDCSSSSWKFWLWIFCQFIFCLWYLKRSEVNQNVLSHGQRITQKHKRAQQKQVHNSSCFTGNACCRGKWAQTWYSVILNCCAIIIFCSILVWINRGRGLSLRWQKVKNNIHTHILERLWAKIFVLVFIIWPIWSLCSLGS